MLLSFAKLDELVKARFVEMFGTYPKNENGFPVAVISDVANVSVGVVIKPAQYYVTEECGIKAFRSLNIGEMYIKDSDWVYFSTEGSCCLRSIISKSILSNVFEISF